MYKQKRWFDRLIERWCEALNDAFSGQRLLAAVGYGMAGLKGMEMLPLDRRLGSNVIKMSGQVDQFRVDSQSRHREGTNLEKEPSGPNRYIVGYGTNPSDKDCGFWAYCHMQGMPCTWCSGKNNLTENTNVDYKSLCPEGTNAQSAWYGCCRNPQRKIRMIAFVDCCGRGFCSVQFWERCANFNAAKNWCAAEGSHLRWPQDRGPNSYYCTIAVDQGDICG